MAINQEDIKTDAALASLNKLINNPIRVYKTERSPVAILIQVSLGFLSPSGQQPIKCSNLTLTVSYHFIPSLLFTNPIIWSHKICVIDNTDK
jgi:hypothetical protein